MTTMTRREHMSRLLGLATLSCLSPGASAAVDAPVPLQGIGRRIRHLSHSDQGGRPDGVQIMINRRHVYVGHMFSDGVTILDAADPRRLKPVGFFTAGARGPPHHPPVAGHVRLLSHCPNNVPGQSYDHIRAS